MTKCGSVGENRMFSELNNCIICPRECAVNRNAGHKGYCGYDSGYHVASVFVHKGEEPPVKGANGICNVFFKGCNLRCSYCQNYQISRATTRDGSMTLEMLGDRIISCLDQGIEAVGFVSPSHFVPHVKSIITWLNMKGYHPITVYNTNGYDKPDMLRDLESLIDLYLPDFKYLNGISAGLYSGAADYPGIAKKSLKEMYRQKGSTLVLNENGQAVTGLIIRHLVLPGHATDSVEILEWIATELSPSVHISLMSQYTPTVCISGDPVIDRHITVKEYQHVVEAMDRLGFYRGWIQEFESQDNYKPDFNKDTPFK